MPVQEIRFDFEINAKASKKSRAMKLNIVTSYKRYISSNFFPSFSIGFINKRDFLLTLPSFRQSVVIFISIFLNIGTQSMDSTDGIEYFRIEMDSKIGCPFGSKLWIYATLIFLGILRDFLPNDNEQAQQQLLKGIATHSVNEFLWLFMFSVKTKWFNGFYDFSFFIRIWHTFLARIRIFHMQTFDLKSNKEVLDKR